MTPTPEQIAMARRVAAGLWDGETDIVSLILAGDCDNDIEVRAALAAIIETTDRAGNLARKYSEGDNVIGTVLAAALYSGLHLKGEQ